MKKNLVALLLVLAVVSVGLFAGPTVAEKTFQLSTTISAINQMKFTAGSVSTRQEFLGDTKDLSGGVAVGNGAEDVVKVVDEETFYDVAYISTMSNYRKGFYVTMSATQQGWRVTLTAIRNISTIRLL